LKPGRSSRKSHEDIVYAIMEALPVRHYVTIEELARRTGSSWETVWRWLSLMMKIQDMPRVQSMKSPLGRGEVYSRERARHVSRDA
jgi:hypothetical protein